MRETGECTDQKEDIVDIFFFLLVTKPRASMFLSEAVALEEFTLRWKGWKRFFLLKNKKTRAKERGKFQKMLQEMRETQQG